MIHQFHALIVEVEAATHPAAVKPRVLGHPLEIAEDLVVLLIIQVLLSGGGVVEAKLNGGSGDLPKPLQIGHQLIHRIVFIEHAVHPEGHRKLGQQGVVGLHHIVLKMARNIDAGNFSHVPFNKVQHCLLRLICGNRKCSVDVYFVGRWYRVHHYLKCFQISL